MVEIELAEAPQHVMVNPVFPNVHDFKVNAWSDDGQMTWDLDIRKRIWNIYGPSSARPWWHKIFYGVPSGPNTR